MIQPTSTRFAVLALVAALASTVGAAKPKATDAPLKLEGAQVETYKTVGDVKLRLYIFNPPGLRTKYRWPAAVFFFGGGWVGGTPKQFEPHARYLASRGMVAVLADYRVASRHKTSPIECVKDGCSAVRYLRVHANRLQIDPGSIVAGGGSAGGHVAAATATVTAFHEEGEDTKISCVPNALALFNPVFDNGPDGWGHAKVRDYWQKISPMHNIRKGIAPSIVFLGTQDKLIPVTVAKKWKSQVEAVKGRADVHLYEGQGHGFFNQRKNSVHYAKTVYEMDRFLASLGYLKGPPTITLPE